MRTINRYSGDYKTGNIKESNFSGGTSGTTGESGHQQTEHTAKGRKSGAGGKGADTDSFASQLLAIIPWKVKFSVGVGAAVLLCFGLSAMIGEAADHEFDAASYEAEYGSEVRGLIRN